MRFMSSRTLRREDEEEGAEEEAPPKDEEERRSSAEEDTREVRRRAEAGRCHVGTSQVGGEENKKTKSKRKEEQKARSPLGDPVPGVAVGEGESPGTSQGGWRERKERYSQRNIQGKERRERAPKERRRRSHMLAPRYWRSSKVTSTSSICTWAAHSQ